jgi:hypothetical protein
LGANLDFTPHRTALSDRIEVARRLVRATQLQIPPVGNASSLAAPPDDVSREARGLAVLLLFAAYENLLTSLCRSLLEAAAKSRARARRLKPGLQLFLIHSELASLSDGGIKKLWRTSGLKLLTALVERPAREIDQNLFPDDGSYMKNSQVAVFCRVFDLGDPLPVLREVWPRINIVVDQRNGIAHGRLTPEEVGRTYTHAEVLGLISLWELR